MSNHSGSYLLNEVIGILDRERVFERMGIADSQRMVTEIVQLCVKKYDCNPGEILEEHGQRLGICYYCLSSAQSLEEGLCVNCRAVLYPQPETLAVP